MIIRYTFNTAMRGLSANKTRSTLTILGIVIGIMAIIAVMSLGEGAQNLILGEIQSMGARVIEVRPGREPKGAADVFEMFGDALKEKDLIALSRKENLPYAQVVEPLVFGSIKAIFESESFNSTVYGVGENFARMYTVEVDEGRNINDDDVKSGSDVVVIGSKVKEELFGSSEVLGQKIKIKGRNFRVVGILAQKGQGSLISFDDVVLVPWTTAQQYIFGIKYFQHILVEVDSEENINRTLKDITDTMRMSHNITDPEMDDFSASSQAQALAQVETVMMVLTLFLAAVAAISLIVGGVGIMNIMLVSVTERTREIGLRKALGATEKNILNQFLFEAVILTGTGGLLGIILGLFSAFLLSYVLTNVLGVNWNFSFPVFAIILGFGVSSLVGLVFGLYPAKEAAKKSPIEALRYE